MADIELIIKIPEEEYDLIVNDEACGLNVLTRAIAKGTPLDKHDEKVIAETVESIWGKPPYMDILDKCKAESEDYEE